MEPGGDGFQPVNPIRGNGDARAAPRLPHEFPPFRAVGPGALPELQMNRQMSRFMTKGFKEQCLVDRQQQDAVESYQALADMATPEGTPQMMAELNPDLERQAGQSPETTPAHQVLVKFFQDLQVQGNRS